MYCFSCASRPLYIFQISVHTSYNIAFPYLNLKEIKNNLSQIINFHRLHKLRLFGARIRVLVSHLASNVCARCLRSQKLLVYNHKKIETHFRARCQPIKAKYKWVKENKIFGTYGLLNENIVYYYAFCTILSVFHCIHERFTRFSKSKFAELLHQWL